MKSRLVLFPILGTLLLAGKAAGTADDVIASINAHARYVESGRFLVRTETAFFGQEAASSPETTEEELTFDGVRSRLERAIQRPTEPVGSPRRLETLRFLFDGEKVIKDEPSQEFLGLGHEVTAVTDLAQLPRLLSLPQGLLDAVVRAQVIHDALLGDALRGVYKAKQEGEEEVAGVHCLRFVGPTMDHGSWQSTYTWWIAPQKGYALAQYADEGTWTPPGTATYRKDVETVEQWMQTEDGFWLPEVTVKRTYIQNTGAAEPELRRVDTTTILSSAVNIPISDEVFKVSGK